MTRSRTAFVVAGSLLVITVGLALISLTSMGSAQERFSNATVEGKYGGVFEGNIAGQPFAAIGFIRLDGEGKCYSKGFANIGDTGAQRSDTRSCSYNIRPNGLGSVTISSSDDRIMDMTFKVVLTRDGNSAYFVSATPGTVVQGEATRQ